MQPGDTHVLVCNFEGWFAPVFSASTDVFTEDYLYKTWVSSAACINGEWPMMSPDCQRTSVLSIKSCNLSINYYTCACV
jgi:hypothetical protein